MITNEEVFTHQVHFKNIGYNIEFLRDGQVWCKTGQDQATKVNAPGAGNIITLYRNTIVKCDPMDAPTGATKGTNDDHQIPTMQGLK